MRPSDPRQQSSSRPNLMSGNRKRAGAGGNILDQLEPRAARGKTAHGFRIGIEPRWVWAAGGAIVLLVAALASIAWSSTTTATALPPPSAPLAQANAPAAVKPVFEAGPARVERVSLHSHQAAAVLLAQVEPPPMPPAMPLVVLPKATAAKVVRQPAVQKPRPAAASKAATPAGPRQASRRGPARQRSKPEPAPQASQKTDPDVALIRAIRKATQPPSE